MTKEEFCESVLQKIHEGWALSEKGAMVDLHLLLGRKDKQTGYPLPPDVIMSIRGWVNTGR